jgi:hypothetical protein
MGTQRWTNWTPQPHDTAQVDEVTRARMVYHYLSAGLAEDERCLRAFRATEVERVIAELRRASSAVISEEPLAPAHRERLERAIASTRYVEIVSVLNLMGIETMLPGEPHFDVGTVLPEGTHVHLQTAPNGTSAVDVLDALSGLIGDFRRLTIFINGLRIEQTITDHDVHSAVVAAHPAIMVAFGEFLIRKYVIEGWRLE